MSAPRPAQPWTGHARTDGDPEPSTRVAAPWHGLRSPAAWTCPTCGATAEADEHGALVARHTSTCPPRRPGP